MSEEMLKRLLKVKVDSIQDKEIMIIVYKYLIEVLKNQSKKE